MLWSEDIMEAIRIQTKLLSQIVNLPQVSKWIGKEVEIIVLPVQDLEGNNSYPSNHSSRETPLQNLVGTVLEYLDPFEPVTEDIWEVLQ
jgi:hypothetical protein